MKISDLVLMIIFMVATKSENVKRTYIELKEVKKIDSLNNVSRDDSDSFLKERSIIKTYHHIIKKILPEYPEDTNISNHLEISERTTKKYFSDIPFNQNQIKLPARFHDINKNNNKSHALRKYLNLSIEKTHGIKKGNYKHLSKGKDVLKTAQKVSKPKNKRILLKKMWKLSPKIQVYFRHKNKIWPPKETLKLTGNSQRVNRENKNNNQSRYQKQHPIKRPKFNKNPALNENSKNSKLTEINSKVRYERKVSKKLQNSSLHLKIKRKLNQMYPNDFRLNKYSKETPRKKRKLSINKIRSRIHYFRYLRSANKSTTENDLRQTTSNFNFNSSKKIKRSISASDYHSSTIRIGRSLINDSEACMECLDKKPYKITLFEGRENLSKNISRIILQNKNLNQSSEAKLSTTPTSEIMQLLLSTKDENLGHGVLIFKTHPGTKASGLSTVGNVNKIWPQPTMEPSPFMNSTGEIAPSLRYTSFFPKPKNATTQTHLKWPLTKAETYSEVTKSPNLKISASSEINLDSIIELIEKIFPSNEIQVESEEIKRNKKIAFKPAIINSTREDKLLKDMQIKRLSLSLWLLGMFSLLLIVAMGFLVYITSVKELKNHPEISDQKMQQHFSYISNAEANVVKNRANQNHGKDEDIQVLISVLGKTVGRCHFLENEELMLMYSDGEHLKKFIEKEKIR